jgi:hypothetical protein
LYSNLTLLDFANINPIKFLFKAIAPAQLLAFQLALWQLLVTRNATENPGVDEEEVSILHYHSEQR